MGLVKWSNAHQSRYLTISSNNRLTLLIKTNLLMIGIHCAFGDFNFLI